MEDPEFEFVNVKWDFGAQQSRDFSVIWKWLIFFSNKLTPVPFHFPPQNKPSENVFWCLQ